MHLCQLLANQATEVRDSYAIRVSLIQHLFTTVVPLPLPCTHPERATRCFWASQSLRYETQKDLLQLLHLVTRHFSAAAFSLRVTSSFDAARILTMAAVAMVADAVLRLRACDIPSKLALHYSGAPGVSVAPYGFDIGNFAAQSELLLFPSPQLAALRTQILDYFTAQRVTGLVPPDHLLFQFEQVVDCPFSYVPPPPPN